MYRMGRTVGECRWPALPERYDAALRAAVAFIFERYSPVGVVASGTIVRGNPAPTSDLDLYVVHRRPERQRLQRYFRGLPAEIFVNPPEQVERYFAAERRGGRPITAHMLATGFVIFEGQADGTLARLRALAVDELARPPIQSEADLTRDRYMVATCLEDALDVADSDPETCSLILARAVDGALCYRFRAAGRWLPRAKDLLAALSDLDPDLARLARGFHAADRHDERVRLGTAAVERGIGATGFFEWESEREGTGTAETQRAPRPQSEAE
jgi:predicted nucleotidyltransferase